MSDITFTYDIISVNEPARCMEIIYKSDGRETMHIGARLPFENENLKDIILSFAPIGYWKERETPVIVPPIGHSGTITITTPPVFEMVLLPAQDQPVQEGAEVF